MKFQFSFDWNDKICTQPFYRMKRKKKNKKKDMDGYGDGKELTNTRTHTHSEKWKSNGWICKINVCTISDLEEIMKTMKQTHQMETNIFIVNADEWTRKKREKQILTCIAYVMHSKSENE